jgi:hypothetical protein
VRDLDAIAWLHHVTGIPSRDLETEVRQLSNGERARLDRLTAELIGGSARLAL